MTVRQLRNSKGFTLIELMIVVVIIGILAAIAIPKFTSVSKGAKEAEAEPVLKQIRSLQESQKLKSDAYAANLAGLDGWSDPAAKYYTFATSATCASASPNAAGTAASLSPKSMDLATGTLHDSADCS